MRTKHQFHTMLFIVYMLGLMACQEVVLDKPIVESENNFIFNPIDTILGDKVLHVEPREFRYDNFSSLVDLDEEYLNWDSDLYEIEKLDDTRYILRQKKAYTNARTFNLILKTAKGKIKSYYALNDFQTIDAELEPEHSLILVSDFGIYSEHWKSEQQIKSSN